MAELLVGALLGDFPAVEGDDRADLVGSVTLAGDEQDRTALGSAQQAGGEARRVAGFRWAVGSSRISSAGAARNAGQRQPPPGRQVEAD